MDADGTVVRTVVIDRAVIDAGKRLAIISRHGVGYDAVDVEAAAERSIPVAITPLANSVSVAEHVTFLLLALGRDHASGLPGTRASRWVFGVFPQVRVAFTGIGIYTWDVAFRAATVEGFVGAGGMGWYLAGTSSVACCRSRPSGSPRSSSPSSCWCSSPRRSPRSPATG